MYDLSDLESKWIAYKRQKYKKFLSLGAAFFVVALISFLAAYLIFAQKRDGESAKKECSEPNATKHAQQPQAQNDVVELTLAGEQPMQREIVIVSPAEQKQEFRSFAPTDEQPLTPAATQGSPAQPAMTPAATQGAPAQPAMTSTPPKPKVAPKINIETKTVSRTELLEDRFKRNADFETALGLSEEYYKIGEYQKALKWAISANSLDSKNERSWVLFAKSSYKLGRKQDAINALENFTKTSDSEQARILLRQIKAGEL